MYGGHVRSNVIGTVEPALSQLVSLIAPFSDRFVFHQFLDTFTEEVHPKNIIVTSFSTVPVGTRSNPSISNTSRLSIYRPTARISTPSNSSGNISKVTA